MILNSDRIRAASHINRWRGWTYRPYSILEHSVIGCHVMKQFGYSVFDQRAFLLHDMHETEIVGDVPTPDKRRYMQTNFALDCEEFDRKLSIETGVPKHLFKDEAVRHVDWIMLCAENDAIAVEDEPKAPFDPNDKMHMLAWGMIHSEAFRGDAAIREFEKLWSV